MTRQRGGGHQTGPPVEAVSFDFYNTLVYHRTGRGRGAMLMEYLYEQGLESDPWEHQVLYDVFEPHGREYDPDQSPEDKQQYFRRLTVRVFQRLGIRLPASMVADHADNVWNILGPASLAVFPEVADVLRLVRQAGFHTAVISNWQCGLRHFCTELGLRHAFDHVLASAEVGAVKPDPAIFREACCRLGAAPHRVLHVGDSVADDVDGGRNAGLRVVLLQRAGLMDDGVPAIGSLSELPDLLRIG